jgi:hypothetical protein
MVENKNTERSLVFLATILDLVIKYGVPATIGAVKAFKVTEPTVEDFEKLRELVKKPEAYFE